MKKHIFVLIFIPFLFSRNSFAQTNDTVFPELKWVNEVGAKSMPERKYVFNAK